MKLKNFIFITTEGHTFQPDSDFAESEIDNAQVIGFENGLNPEDAFNNLLENNEYLKDANFNEVICYELDINYENNKRYFYLKVS